jgi:hypothetical protein
MPDIHTHPTGFYEVMPVRFVCEIQYDVQDFIDEMELAGTPGLITQENFERWARLQFQNDYQPGSITTDDFESLSDEF